VAEKSLSLGSEERFGVVAEHFGYGLFENLGSAGSSSSSSSSAAAAAAAAAAASVGGGSRSAAYSYVAPDDDY
jgi:hypothetical protein